MKSSLLLLGELSEDSMTWLSQTGQRLTLEKGKVLIHEGERVEDIFILLSGSLSVTTASPGVTDHRRLVARLNVGDVIGEMSFIDQRPPSATVTAEEDCIVLAVPQKVLRERTVQETEFGQQFYRGLAYCLSNRLRMMNVSLPQAGIEVSGTLPLELDNPTIQDSLPLAKARLEMLIDTNR